MKFGKEFASQMVPEWQQAYMDYDYLKTLLKEVQRFKQRTRPPAMPKGLKRKNTLYRAFSGLITQRHSHDHRPSPGTDIENPIIVLNSVNKDGCSEKYETMFLLAADEGGEYELVYFRRLDDEFNKVVKFYKSKVEEVMNEATLLSKQMDAFIAFRIKVENPQGWFDKSAEITNLATNIAVSTASLSATTPSGATASRRVSNMDVIEESGSSSQGQSDESSHDKETRSTNQNVAQQNTKKSRGRTPAPLEAS